MKLFEKKYVPILKKKIIIWIEKGACDKFISNIENDIHRWQKAAHNIRRHLNKQEKDTTHLHIIEKDTWAE